MTTDRVWPGLVLGALWIVGCDKQLEAGDPCKPADARCLDPHTELACENGVLIAAPCKGPNGCREGKAMLLCDFSANEAGDRCSAADEGNGACLEGNQRWIVCRSGAYRIEPCRGEQGCRRSGGTLRCDQSRAEAGDACSGATNACDPFGMRVMTCKNGKFEESAVCGGEAGCAIEGGEIKCDLGKKQPR
jgi:hypothetical protein